MLLDQLQSKLVALCGIFFCSLFAAGLPILSRSAMNSRLVSGLFFIGRHFGTGVILATAFAHLLQDAFENLAKAGPGWRQVAGVATLGSLLSIFLLEYACTAYVEYFIQRKGSTFNTLPSATRPSLNGPTVPAPPSYRDDDTDTDPESRDIMTPLPSEANQHASCFFEHRPSWKRRRTTSSIKSIEVPAVFPHVHDRPHPHNIEDELSTLDRRTQIISLLVLQVGIMMHSLIIGMTLAFTTGPDFTSLLLAIVFHQLFEGISLGVRISELPEHHHRRVFTLPRILVTLFALTVPAGILLGLFALPKQVPQVAGIMQAASAGMLIYAGLVEMLAEDFVHSSPDRVQGLDGLKALVSLFAGASLMSILGWA